MYCYNDNDKSMVKDNLNRLKKIPKFWANYIFPGKSFHRSHRKIMPKHMTYEGLDILLIEYKTSTSVIVLLCLRYFKRVL